MSIQVSEYIFDQPFQTAEKVAQLNKEQAEKDLTPLAKQIINQKISKLSLQELWKISDPITYGYANFLKPRIEYLEKKMSLKGLMGDKASQLQLSDLLGNNALEELSYDKLEEKISGIYAKVIIPKIESLVKKTDIEELKKIKKSLSLKIAELYDCIKNNKIVEGLEKKQALVSHLQEHKLLIDEQIEHLKIMKLVKAIVRAVFVSLPILILRLILSAPKILAVCLVTAAMVAKTVLKLIPSLFVSLALLPIIKEEKMKYVLWRNFSLENGVYTDFQLGLPKALIDIYRILETALSLSFPATFHSGALEILEKGLALFFFGKVKNHIFKPQIEDKKQIEARQEKWIDVYELAANNQVTSLIFDYLHEYGLYTICFDNIIHYQETDNHIKE